MPKKDIKKRLVAGWIVSLILCSTSGCIQDDLSDCGIGVTFRYVKNVDGVDKFGDLVDRVSLFVFDEAGSFVGEYDSEGETLGNGYTMNLPLNPGSYQLVAWGNLCEDYELPALVPGKTNMDDILLTLQRANDTINRHPANLFHGGVQRIDIQPPYTGRKTIMMDMMKNTNSIQVKTRGLPASSGSKADGDWGNTFTCTITSVNGDYRFDNSITGNRLTYIPEYSTGDDSLDSDFVIMRELNDGSTGSRLIFTHHGTDGKSDNTLLDTGLTSLLLPASVTGDLDIDDQFVIEVLFDQTNGTVTIRINDWEYKESIVGI